MSDTSWMARGRWMDVPTALIICGWVALWGLWPQRAHQAAAPSLSHSRIIALGNDAPRLPLYVRPDLIAIPSHVSFRADATPDSGTLALPPPGASGGHRYLDRERPDAGDSALLAEAGTATVGRRRPLEVDAAPERMFAGASVCSNCVYTWASDALSRAGFRLPGALLETLPGTVSGSFEVELSVELGAVGQDARVYVERSCGDEALDRRIEALASRACAGTVGPASGTVVISVVKPAGGT